MMNPDDLDDEPVEETLADEEGLEDEGEESLSDFGFHEEDEPDTL